MAINRKRGVNRIMVDLPLALADKVQQMADQQRRSRNFMMVDLIVKGLGDIDSPAVKEERAAYEPMARRNTSEEKKT